MSILPFFLSTPSYSRPSRLLDQHFGLGLEPEDLLAPISRDINRLLQCPLVGHNYYRPWRSSAAQQDVGSTVSLKDNQFQVNLDVQQFSPEEITVKVTGENTITVEGKHEEREDEHGYISRQFVRRYVLPKGHDIGRVESKLSSDGVLTISAPRVDQEAIEHRSIPITQTGQPSRSVEAKKDVQANGDAEN